MENKDNFEKRRGNGKEPMRGRRVIGGRGWRGGRGRGIRGRGNRGRGNRGRGNRGRGNRGRGAFPSRGSFPSSMQRFRNYGESDSDRGNNENYNNSRIQFTYEKLKEINYKNENDIIQFFTNFNNLSQVFDNTIFNTELIDLITEILMKISKIYSDSASNILYQILKNTSYINIAKKRLSNGEYDSENYLNFILNLILLNDKLIDKFTDNSIRIKYGEIKSYVEIIEVMIKNNQYANNLNLAKIVSENMNKLEEKEKHLNLVEIERKQKEKENQLEGNYNYNLNNIPIDYKERNIYLTSEDFIENENLVILPHIKYGSYISYERYINTMFYLEYQDCYKDLKETINYLQLSKSINKMNPKELYELSKEFSNIYFYLEGEIISLELDRDGAIITIQFMTHLYKPIKFTKRMITGSLVILTDNNFENYLLTTVHFNPYVDKKINENKKSDIWLPKFPYYRIKLSLININRESFSFLIKNRQHLQIIESKAYFESYIHIMRRLKELEIPDLPFKKELIDADFTSLIIENENIYNYFNYYVNGKRMILAPYQKKYSKEFMDMFDKSQLKAIHNSLLNKIALIQGPPGTGKTYVGTVLTNILLQNISEDAQILVVCFTNHALDSFIEDIIKYTNNVVRIGGRCQNEIVEQYILNNRQKYSSFEYKNVVKDLDSIGSDMENITSLIDIRRRVSIGNVKKYFENLYYKVINDFFNIFDEAIEKIIEGRFIYRYNPIEIEREIYIFWNLIDINNNNKKNKPDDIIYKLLNNTNVEDETILNNIYDQILEYYNGYNIDNLDLLKKLNYIENIDNNENIEIKNPNKQNEEEEEEDDDEELIQNQERIKFLDIDLENKKNNIEENEELFNDNFDELKRLKILDEAKFNYLINSDINLFKVGPTIIKLIINYMKEKLLSSVLNDYEEDFDEFNSLLDEKKELLSTSDAEAIQKYKIVAMTTTGCAKYSTILEQSNFEVIIIEEAAEVLESHVLSLLTQNTKRLILIGDHKQLKPKPYNYEIETKYNFNVSIFERLINNNIPFSSLKYQRRMKPKFADFVRIIYGETEYQDHNDTLNRPNVNGIINDMYFITHNKPEGENSGLKSKFNDYEAKYLAKLCKYLLQQEYSTKQITILTFYLGQVLIIKKYLREYLKEDIAKEIRVSSVDNYQGEECDIILLSLVRSNKEYKIGFLKTFNRVCVAFSRAKIGLYIIGNMECIVTGEKIFRDKNKNKKYIDIKMLDVWERIEKKAKELNIIGNKLTLICKNHKNITIIENEKDFAKCPEGGCQELCKKRMNCGHVCEKVCHVYDCEKIKCMKPCERINQNCQQLIKHKCTKLCYKECGECEFIVDKKLRCGHIQRNMKCYEKPKLCEVLVDKELPCGHIQRIECYKSPKICEVLVDKELPCGHIQRIECSKKPKICKVLVDKILPCGHCQRLECYKSPKICEVLVSKLLPCGHTKQNCLCYENPNNIKCEENCKRKLKCGHPCKLKCYEDCANQICYQKIIYKIPQCNHSNQIECYLKSYPIKIICQEPCLQKLPCGHICAGTCGRCLQGTLHIRCFQKCTKKLICGHICNQECSSECICNEKYDKLCIHQKCKMNCYEIENNCSEPCLRKCEHFSCKKSCNEICDKKPCNKRCELKMKCGHQCHGLCGEICPDICQICNNNGINIKSNEDVDLLYKTLCGDVLPLKQIDVLFYKQNVELFKCPKCNNPLLLETRYKEQINDFFKTLHQIKKESYDKNKGNDDNTFYNAIRNIIRNNLMPQYNYNNIKIFENLNKNNKISYSNYNLYQKIPTIYKLIQKFNDHDLEKNASLYHLMTLAEKFMGIEYYAYLIKNKYKMEDIDFDFLKNFNELKNYFNASTIQFDQYFFKELKRKIDNMLYYAILRIKNVDEENIGFFEYLFGSKKITSKDIAKSYFSLDLKLKDLYDNDYSETKNIFKSLSSKWYKCPSGHIYTSDEVDNNNELSCPYCTLGDKAFIVFKKIFRI